MHYQLGEPLPPGSLLFTSWLPGPTPDYPSWSEYRIPTITEQRTYLRHPNSQNMMYVLLCTTIETTNTYLQSVSRCLSDDIFVDFLHFSWKHSLCASLLLRPLCFTS